MTLDEAIIHAEEIAEINENIAYNTDSENWMDIAQCEKCAEEHRQLAEWLKELKMYKSADEQDDNRLYIKIYADDKPSRKAEKLYQICGETESQEVVQWLKEYFPSADRPTGEWIKTEHCLNDTGYRRWIEIECPFCGERPTYEFLENMNYCPNCGAYMKGENK